jgi:hypothetical protein
MSEGVAGKMFDPIEHDEHGVQLSLAGAMFGVWAASLSGNFDADLDNCGAWTNTTHIAFVGSCDRTGLEFEFAVYTPTQRPVLLRDRPRRRGRSGSRVVRQRAIGSIAVRRNPLGNRLK